MSRRTLDQQPEQSRARCGIVPPYLLAALAMCDDPALAARAARTLQRDTLARQLRLSPSAPVRPADRRSTTTTGTRPKGTKPATTVDPADGGEGAKRTVSDAHNEETLPGDPVRSEGRPAVEDVSVNQAYDGLGATWQLYSQAFARNSLDGKGLPLLASVHYAHDYDNAYWDGDQMVFGDGDGKIFGRFTGSIDVIGHELTHGVTDYTAGLRYQGQSGALNESISDVFGILVKQKVLGQSADQADWLIGADLLLPGVDGVALRSMKAPGTAYDDPVLGKDPQPAQMADYLTTSADNGGVHLNSGIPNKAFYLVAAAIGGNAWESAGRIWYSVLTGGPIKADCDFVTFAGLCIDAAGQLFGTDSTEQQATAGGWQQVGVLPPNGTDPAGENPAAHDPPPADDAQPAPGRSTAHAQLTIRRSGGFAGRTVERTVRLGELPHTEAAQWASLLGGGLRAMVGGPSRPDAFVYQVEAGRLEVTIAEHDLPPEVRGLLRRTVEGG